MFCPSCDYHLQKLSVTTNSGGRFEIDHCGRCGGTWFDPYEINRIPLHEVHRLAHLTVLPKSLQPSKSTLLCPRCHKKLVLSHYESLPKNIHLHRCPRCGGLWATQKALKEFKIHQEKTIEDYKKSGLAFPSLSVVFVPATFLILLFFATFLTVSYLQEEKESRIKAQENIVGLSVFNPARTSIVIAFQTKTSLKSFLLYGESSLELEKKVISQTPSTSHHLFLTDLKPKTLYIYKIILEDQKERKYTTPEYFFLTLP